MYFGPKYDKPFIFAEAIPKYAKMKPRCIHCVLHDVDGDGDLDFVGSYVREVFWLECPDKNPTSTQWKMHLITDQIFGVHCIRSFDIDQDGKKDLITNDFTDDKGPYSRSVCWLRPKFSQKKPVEWSIIQLAKGTAQGAVITLTLEMLTGTVGSILLWEPRVSPLRMEIILRFIIPIRTSPSLGEKSCFLVRVNNLEPPMLPRQMLMGMERWISWRLVATGLGFSGSKVPIGSNI